MDIEKHCVYDEMKSDYIDYYLQSEVDEKIEKMNQYINTVERMNSNQFDKIESQQSKIEKLESQLLEMAEEINSRKKPM